MSGPAITSGGADPTVCVAIQDGVAVLTLNRPAQLNAITREMGERLDEAFGDLGRNPAVRVVVITGAGRGFCAGADMGRLEDLAVDGGAELSRRASSDASKPFSGLDAPEELKSRYLAPMAIPQPTIAAVNGACAGVGFALAMHCDVRFGGRDALFAAAFPRRGLIAEQGLAWSLPRIVGWAVASDLLLSGRRVGAEEAARLGLIGAVVDGDVLSHSLAYARDMAEHCSPRSTRIIKQQLRMAQQQPHDVALEMAHVEAIAALASADFQEGVASFRERRLPKFSGH